MKKPLALAALAALPAFAFAADPVPLDTVYVIGTRSEQPGNRLPAAVTVITREQIEASGAKHIVEALRLAGALQITDLYGDGSRATVDLRGFGDAAGSTTLILVDGRRLNNTDIAPPDLDTIALQDVERIEIIEGSGGALYGDQAVGGVINIITRKPGAFTAGAAANAGSYDSYGMHASVAQRWSNASARLSAERRESENYRAHNGLDYKDVLARVGFDGAKGGMFVEGGYVFEDLLTPGPLFAADVARDRRQSLPQFDQDFSDTHTGFLRVNIHGDISEHWHAEADLDHRRSNGNFRLSFISGFSSPGSQDRELRAAHPRLVGTYGRTLLTLGADGLLSDYELNSAAFGLQTNKQRLGELYAQVVTPLARTLEITAGARFSRVENKLQDGFAYPMGVKFHDTQPAGELGLAWQLAPAVKLYTRYDRTFRFAKVDEQTLTCGKLLDSQTGDSYEAGAEIGIGAGSLRASAFHIDLHNEIAYDPNSCFGANINLERTRREGVGLQGKLGLGERVSVDASVRHLDSEVTGGSLTGHEIPLAARNTGTLALGGRLPAGLSTHIELQAVDSRPLAGDFDNTLARLPGYAVVNLGFDWIHRAWRVGARVNNLLDRAYAEYGASAFDAGFNEAAAFFPSPERNFRLALDYTW